MKINILGMLFKKSPLQQLNEDIAYIISEMDSTGSVEKLQAVVFAESLFQMFLRQDFCLNVMLSPGGNFLLVNQKFKDVLGWEMEEVRSKSFLHFIHPDDVEATERAWNEFKGKAVVDYPKFKNRYRKKGGGFVSLEWLQVPPSSNGFFFTSAQIIKS